jgi:hypothetical protein
MVTKDCLGTIEDTMEDMCERFEKVPCCLFVQKICIGKDEKEKRGKSVMMNLEEKCHVAVEMGEGQFGTYHLISPS